MKTAAKRYLEKVASIPCACCGAHGVQVHHIREGQGMSQRASDFLTIPLCPDCHQGSENGIHGKKRMMKVMKLTELDMLASTIERLICGS